MTSYVTPRKNVQYIFYVGLQSQTDTKLLQTNPTLAAGDVKVSIDGGALANLATLPVVTPAASKSVKVTLSTSEMNGDNITVIFSDAAGAEWCDMLINIQTTAVQIDDLARTGADADTLETLSDQIDLVATATNLATVDTVVDAIKAVTDLLPNGGALSDLAAILADTGTDIPALIAALNDISSGDVQTAIALELATYDPPTHAELVAEIDAVQADIAALNDISSGDVQMAVALELALYDPPTTAELVAEIDAVQADIAALSVTGLTAQEVRDAMKLAPTAGAPDAGSVDAHLDDILADTNELQGDWVNGGRLDNILDSRASQASLDVVDDFLDTEIAAIKAVTDLLPNGGALSTIQADLDNLQTRLPAALVGGRIDANVGNLEQAALAQFVTDDTGEVAAVAGSVAGIAQGAAGGNVTVGAMTPEALAQFVTDDTGETEAAAGSVAALSQGCEGAGIGLVEFTYTVTNTVTLLPEPDVRVWITTDLAGTNVVYNGLVTDAFGVARLPTGDLPFLDPGTYYFWKRKIGLVDDQNPDTEIVV